MTIADQGQSQPDPRKIQASTYFVQDQSNKEERQRLALQDQMLTTGMGGVLPEQNNPGHFKRVLDVGCGTGGWLIDVAKAYLTTTILCGVDANKRMLEHARICAQEQGVNDRVEFQVMDALRMLEFPDHYFDLVNQRLGMSWLRVWDWHKLLQEYTRVTRPGGIIRLTEGDLHIRSNSPALEALFQLASTAFFHAGHLFTQESQSIFDKLPSLLELHNVQEIETRTITLEYRVGTSEWRLFAADMGHVFLTGAPFLRKWARVPDTYLDLYQQAMKEIEQPDFVAQMNLITAWGIWMPESA